MRQVVITRHGPPDVLDVREAPEPEPGDEDVRIRVRASGVNFADVLARMGLYPDAPPPPCVVGYEVTGTVDAVGARVPSVRPGDRVVAFTNFGGYSDTIVTPARYVFALPANLSDAEGAAIPINYLTAALALYKLANVSAGETVLILGAGGGVGIAATQLARLRRAVIIGTASGAKLGALRGFGVDHVIDHTRENVAGEVRRITRNRGADVVLDPIGGASFKSSYRLLAPLGRLVLYGISSMVAGERRSMWRTLRVLFQMPRFKPLSLMNRNRGVFGLHVGHLLSEEAQLSSMMQMLLREFEGGRIRPVVARTFPLDRAADAHRFVQARGNIGKVVLTV